MPLFYKVQQEELLLGVWKIEEELSEFLSFFSEKDIYESRIREFLSENRKKEWLAVRVLLLELLQTEKQIAYLPSGKPYLEDNSWQISISHTRNYVAIVLHPSLKVGIDIEKIGDKVERVRSKFLKKEEDEAIVDTDRIHHLLLCFSGKETIYKLISKENIELKEHLSVLPFVPDTQGEFLIKELKSGRDYFYQIKYMITSSFVLTYSLDC